MKRVKWLLPTLLLALLGGVLRRWQMNTAFEGELWLCDPSAPASLALIAFVFLAAAVMIIPAVQTSPCLPEDDSPLTPWDTAFAAKGNTVYLALMVLAGFLTLAAVPFLLRDVMTLLAARRPGGQVEFPFLQIVLLLCAIPGGIGHILTARAAARMEGRGGERSALMFPGLLGCVWLLEGYRSNAADPVLWDYVPLLCAVAVGMLFFLSCGSLALDTPRPRRMLWLGGMTVALSGMVLGGAPALPDALLLSAQALAALAALWLVPGNLERMPDPSLFGVEDDEEYEDGEETPTPEGAQDTPAGETPPEEPADEEETAEDPEEAPAEDTKLEDTTHGQ